MPTIVVTGASQGIGRAAALAFAREPGARVLLLSRNEAKLKETAAGCRESGAEAEVYPCDVTDEAAVADVAQRILQRYGSPDVLVNNAGSFRPGGILDTTPTQFREQVEANLTSAFITTRAFLKAIVDARRGTIFYMGSVASIRAYAGGASYCAAKHGLLGLARVVREETRDKGIRVTTLLAGATYTPSWEGVALPEERFMPAEDIAHTMIEVYRMSSRSVVEEILIRPQLGDI